jgi:energy-coupling factor transporter ATP-binding protein EcfA2
MMDKGLPGLSESSDLLIGELFRAYCDPPTGRVFTVMGPNGSGKSRLLRHIRAKLKTKGIPCALLPPTRRQHPINDDPIQTSSPPHNRLQPCDLDSHMDTMFRAATSMPEGGGFAAEGLFQNMVQFSMVADEQNELIYRNQLFAFIDGGQVGEPPKRVGSIADRLQSRMKEILGLEISLNKTFQSGSKYTTNMCIHKDGVPFPIDELSDGEKQILLICGLLLLATSAKLSRDAKFILLVDEPELHLNEARAIELWESLETSFSSVVILYATHCVGFATRPTVATAYTMDQKGQLSQLTPDEPIPPAVINQIVGARIQLLRRASPVIFCEGGLDQLLFADLFRRDVQIVAAGSHDQVRQAVQGEGAWAQLRSKGVPHCGIIDRDCRDQEGCDLLKTRRVFCIPMYDVESLLIVPEIARWYLGRSAGREISDHEFASWLIEAANTKLRDMFNLIKKTIEDEHHPTIHFAVGPNNRPSIERMEEPPDIRDRFQRRCGALVDALDRRSVSDIVTLFRGKSLYKLLYQQSAKRFGVQLPSAPIQKYRELREHGDFRDRIEMLSNLTLFRDEISCALARNS